METPSNKEKSGTFPDVNTLKESTVAFPPLPTLIIATLKKTKLYHSSTGKQTHYLGEIAQLAELLNWRLHS
jgi:hypothetical protein